MEQLTPAETQKLEEEQALQSAETARREKAARERALMRQIARV